ncbi:hypothetical protein GCM10027344_16400 [Spelaeicoccus albus]
MFFAELRSAGRARSRAALAAWSVRHRRADFPVDVPGGREERHVAADRVSLHLGSGGPLAEPLEIELW